MKIGKRIKIFNYCTDRKFTFGIEYKRSSIPYEDHWLIRIGYISILILPKGHHWLGEESCSG